MSLNRIIGAALLVAGTCIGAGMLALPVSTAQAGYYWSGGLVVAAWFVMMLTGLLVLEVNLWFKGKASYVSMAEKTLGSWGKRITWIAFLLLLYALMAAYISGGVALVGSAVTAATGKTMNSTVSLLPWVLVSGALVFFGTKLVDGVNKLLIVGLLVSYVILLVALMPHVAWHPMQFPVNHSYIWASLPILMTSYGYHIVIPSISRYLDHQKNALRLAIILGSTVALLFYLVWEYLIFGVLIPGGKEGLVAILHSGQPAATLMNALYSVTSNHLVATVAECFAGFALCSSFVGVALGLFHLLSDGLNISETVPGKLFLALLTFVPPLGFALLYPKGFIMALGYAGVLVALIHGILPALMVWRGRYNLGLAKGAEYRAPGGKVLLIVLSLICLAVLGAEVAGHLGVIPKL
jgi:tyrosine-specific transport protein